MIFPRCATLHAGQRKLLFLLTLCPYVSRHLCYLPTPHKRNREASITHSLPEGI